MQFKLKPVKCDWRVVNSGGKQSRKDGEKRGVTLRAGFRDIGICVFHSLMGVLLSINTDN